MNRKKLMIVGGLFIIALAVMGIGYGLWFEDLAIGGHVQTGVLDIEFSGPWVHEWFRNYNGEELVRREMVMDADPIWVEDPEHPDGGYYVPVYEYYGPEELYQKFDTVGCYAFYTPEELGENYGSIPSGPDMMRFEVYGMYPSYTCQVNFDLHNPGTVPFHILWAGHPENQEQAIESFMCYFKDMEPINMLEEGGRLAEWQVHQGEHIDCEVVFHFTNEIAEERGIGEDNHFEFFYAMRAYQWNEYDAPGVIDWNPFGPSVEPGEPEGKLKGFAVRYRSFGNTGGDEMYLGRGDLGVAANRVARNFTSPWGTNNGVTFTYDQPGDRLLAAVDIDSDGTDDFSLEYPDLANQVAALGNGCTVDEVDFMVLSVVGRDADTTVDFNNVMLNGMPLGNFSGTGGWFNWTVMGFDFTQSFTVTGDLLLSGAFGTSQELSKLEIQVGCLP
ncbi:MAG: hypothetical protein Kow00124_30780 [Anaerolineae bacterium]